MVLLIARFRLCCTLPLLKIGSGYVKNRMGMRFFGVFYPRYHFDFYIPTIFHRGVHSACTNVQIKKLLLYFYILV